MYTLQNWLLTICHIKVIQINDIIIQRHNVADIADWVKFKDTMAIPYIIMIWYVLVSVFNTLTFI